ncbi:MAG: DUF2809 domain-containing protein [Bacteroidota bacterium]
MKPYINFNLVYFLLAVLLFGIEVLIAEYAHDRIIRPYVGDVIVAILVYCFARSFLQIPYLVTSVIVLIFCFAIETSQYFHLIEKLGLENALWAKLVLGTSFAWTDLLAYTVGVAIVLFAEMTIGRRQIQPN